MKSKNKKVESAQSNENISFETFMPMGAYEEGSLRKNDPSCFNGMVRIKKYKITCELIEEPKEVYAERLQKLWDESDNHHNHFPLQSRAQKLGIELKGSFGSKAKK